LAGLGLATLTSVLAAATGACGSSGSGSSGSSTDAPDAEIDVAIGPDTSVPELDASAPDVADARKDVLDAGPPFCASLVPKPKFCDDFDDQNLTDDWTSSAAAPASIFELDETTATSAPASFHFGAREAVAAAANNVLLRTTMFGAVTHGKLAFSTLLPTVTFAKGAIAIAQFYVNLDDVFTLYLRSPNGAAPAAELEEYVGGVTTAHPLTKLPPLGVWTRVAIDLDLANGKATVMFDAVKALDATIAVGAGSEATVRIGAIVDGPADAFEGHIDDVVVDF
jgi:hypothetical protein